MTKQNIFMCFKDSVHFHGFLPHCNILYKIKFPKYLETEVRLARNV